MIKLKKAKVKDATTGTVSLGMVPDVARKPDIILPRKEPSRPATIPSRHTGLTKSMILKPTADFYRDKLEQLTKEERKQIVRLNPALFGEYYIKPYTRKWDSDTADHQFMMLEQILLHKNIIIHLPVEHAKSTWCSLVLPLWFLINDRNTQGAIVSNTARQAEKFLAAIKWHIEKNPRLKEDFGDYLIPDFKEKWTDQEIRVIRDQSQQSKDSSIQALGTQGAILGARLDWVIADDILDLGNSQTVHMREKVQDWWDEEVDTRVYEDGHRIMLGTLQHQMDLLCVLADRSSDYYYVHLPAFDKDGNPLWPDQWPKLRLEAQRRKIGTLKFNKIFQCDRTARTGKLLDPEWLTFYGPGTVNPLPPMDDLVIYIGVDPAIAEDKVSAQEKRQDYFAVAILGFHPKTKKVYLLDYFRDWLTFPEQVKKLDELYKLWNERCHVRKIGIEEVYYQMALKQQTMLLDSMPRVVGVKVGGRAKPVRIQSFAVYSENGTFLVRQDHFEFIEEWVEYEPNGDSPDLLEACNTGVIMITNPNSYTSDEHKKLLAHAKLA